TDLKKKASDMKVSKNGTTDQIKERVLQQWLECSPRAEVLAYSGVWDADTSGSASTMHHTDAGSSQKVEDNAAASAAADAHGESGNGASGSSDLTLFGRQTFSMVLADVEDKTNFYTGINEGPALQSLPEPTTAETVAAATDGVLPLAALVKISQGFQETVDDPVAVLLAGILEMKKPKLKRKIVRRVILGPRNLFNPEVLKDELDATGLELWGLVWHESWPVDLQLFAAGVGIADHMDGLYVGKLSRNAPADLSEGNQWLSSKFLDFGAIEARGEQMKDALHASLLQKCNEHNELEEMSKAWQDFTSNILRSPEVLALGKISAFALGQKLGLGQEQVHSHLMAELAVELAVDAGKLNTRDEGDPKWLQEEFPSCDVIKVAFYLQKQTQDKSAKALRSLETMKRKCGLVQKSQTNKKLRAVQALEKAVAKLDPDPDTVEQQLALRNVRNRARTGAKKEKKKRSFDEAFKTAEPKVKRAARISIFQKVQIVDFAENLLQTQKPISQGRRKRKAKPTAGKHHARVNFLRGVNLQRACQQKFPQLGRIKVVTVRRLAREYNKGLEKARQKAIDYNNKLMQDLKDAGVKAKYLSSSFVPIPQACPENLDMKWVRRFLKAYQWKKVARNTAGEKQEGHVISRSDYVPDARKSITVVTSSWSDGTAGPLGLCFPDGSLRQEDVDTFNKTHEGVAMIFASQTSSHFMTAETFMVYLHGLLTPALSLQRKKLGVASSTMALLLCDAWTGFHACKNGLDAAGGFSANAQPVDQLHHLLRARMEVVDAEEISCESYDTLPIGTSGQPVRNKVYTRTSLAERTLRAWLSVPRKAFISAWVATGYFQSEHFPEEQLTPAQAREALDPTGMLLSLGIKNDVIAFGSSQPERWYWALRMEDGKAAALPSIIATSVEKLVCQHRRERQILHTKKPSGWKKKLEDANQRIGSIVYNVRHGCLASTAFLKRSTTRINGKVEFTSKGAGHEILRVHFELDGEEPSGPGTYYLSSLKFEKKAICCVKSSGQERDDASSVEEEGHKEGDEDETDTDPQDTGDGLMAPPDVEPACIEEQELDESTSDSEGLEEYDGDAAEIEHEEPVPAPELPAGINPGAANRIKRYHLSPEWLHLQDAGNHLLVLPDVEGCGVNRHPAGNFWSARYPGHPIMTATYSVSRSPLRCLV
ncbi:Uncharacterized protein (Fragment), partial [Durusdinium trenchii]